MRNKLEGRYSVKSICIVRYFRGFVVISGFFEVIGGNNNNKKNILHVMIGRQYFIFAESNILSLSKFLEVSAIIKNEFY